MDASTLLRQLEKLGSAQTRKTYARHGVVGKQFGVSYASLYKLQKQIKVDHELARKLWASGAHDARVLATMIADPEQATSALLDAWLGDLDNKVIADAFSGYVAKTALALKNLEKWTKSKEEWIGQTGFGLLARLAMQENDLPDSYFEKHLGVITKDIHRRPNFVRYAMGGAVIAIGIRNESLKKKALAAAKVIGKVDVDHGDTSCKTPDIAAYIDKVYKRKKGRARS